MCSSGANLGAGTINSDFRALDSYPLPLQLRNVSTLGVLIVVHPRFGLQPLMVGFRKALIYLLYIPFACNQNRIIRRERGQLISGYTCTIVIIEQSNLFMFSTIIVRCRSISSTVLVHWCCFFLAYALQIWLKKILAPHLLFTDSDWVFRCLSRVLWCVSEEY